LDWNGTLAGISVLAGAKLLKPPAQETEPARWRDPNVIKYPNDGLDTGLSGEKSQPFAIHARQ
jgi:hypothetical protein